MTYDQAASAVEDISISSDLHVDLGYGHTLDIPVSEIMGSMDIHSALDHAWNYGRGEFLSGGAKLISALLLPRDFAMSKSGLDKTLLRKYVSDAVDQFSVEMEKYAALVGEDKILVKRGVIGLTYDEENLYSRILAAFEKPDFSDIVYEPQADVPEEPDYEAIHSAVYMQPKDAYLAEDMTVVSEVVGKDFDIGELRTLVDAAAPGEIVTLAITITEPATIAETLSAMLYKDVLAEYSTYVTNNANRNNNIGLASSIINGQILRPGDVFSFNGTVGQRTTERGFKLAGAYVNGAVVDEVGGGICQVSSTIYMTVLLANLEIVERTCHQFVVSYLPFGMDATVNWGTTDFKFKNNTSYPIKIEAGLADGTVTVRLIGTKTDTNYVQMTYEILGTYPFSTIETPDASVAEGQTIVKTTGSTGYSVRTYRHIYDANGTELSSALEASSYYSKRDKVVLVPVITPTPSPSPEPTPPPSPEPTPPLEPTPSPTPIPEPTPSPSPSPTQSHTPTIDPAA